MSPVLVTGRRWRIGYRSCVDSTKCSCSCATQSDCLRRCASQPKLEDFVLNLRGRIQSGLFYFPTSGFLIPTRAFLFHLVAPVSLGWDCNFEIIARLASIPCCAKVMAVSLFIFLRFGLAPAFTSKSTMSTEPWSAAYIRAVQPDWSGTSTLI